MLGSALSRTLGSAVELDRVVGDGGDSGAGSYLGIPDDTLGSLVASPLLTVTATRKSPSVTAVKWDDDGVETAELPIISKGHLENYLASRESIISLERLAAAPGPAAVRPAGCAFAPGADDPVLVRVPHLTVVPGGERASLDDLCKDIARGVLVLRGYLTVDQQLRSGLLFNRGAMLEIVNGKIVRRLEANGLQFNTNRFWRSLTSLGDATTVEQTAVRLYKGQPARSAWSSASAPAALFKDVDIISTKGQI
jgi:predicted Zn-dependent protease